MNIQTFYLILIFLISFAVFISAISAIFSRNLIFSVFSLIFYFFSGIWFFLFYKAEYVMVLFLIIYLGAIVVFFLFVLMLIDKKYWEMRTQTSLLFSGSSFFSFRYLSFLILFIFSVFVVFTLLIIGLQNFNVTDDMSLFLLFSQDKIITNFILSNSEKIGIALYSEFGLLLIIGGVILLVAIVGCVLIIRPFRPKKKKD